MYASRRTVRKCLKETAATLPTLNVFRPRTIIYTRDARTLCIYCETSPNGHLPITETSGNRTLRIPDTYIHLNLKTMTQRRQQNALASGLTITNSFNKLVVERYDKITTTDDGCDENINISTANVSYRLVS